MTATETEKVAKETSIIENAMKKFSFFSAFLSVVFGIIAALTVVYGFYYETNSTIRQHSQELKSVKTDIELTKQSLYKTNLDTSIAKEKLNSLDEKINNVEKHMNRIEDKLDRILIQTR